MMRRAPFTTMPTLLLNKSTVKQTLFCCVVPLYLTNTNRNFLVWFDRAQKEKKGIHSGDKNLRASFVDLSEKHRAVDTSTEQKDKADLDQR